jgi:HEAT repeat protein
MQVSGKVMEDAIQALSKDSVWQVRRSAVAAVADALISKPVAQDIIEHRWDDEEHGVRAQVARTIGLLGVSGDREWGILRELLDDQKSTVAKDAIRALAKCFPSVEKIGGMLIDALEDESVYVRRAACLAMAGVLDGDKSSFVAPLLLELNDSDEHFVNRICAVKALASVGNQTVIDGLVKYIESNQDSRDRSVLGAAIDGLRSIPSAAVAAKNYADYGVGGWSGVADEEEVVAKPQEE